MKKLVFLLFALLSSFSSDAQSYNTAIGVRFGNDLGFSLQQRIANKTTAEAMFYGGRSTPDAFVNVLLRQHLSLLSKKLNAYVGVGVGSHWQVIDDQFTTQKYTIPGVIGMEMSFGRLNISGDIMPHLILNNGQENAYKSFANVGLRIILAKRKMNAKEKVKDKLGDILPEKKKKKKLN